MCASVHEGVRVRVCVWVRVRACVYGCACMRVCAHVWMCVWVCVSACMCLWRVLLYYIHTGSDYSDLCLHILGSASMYHLTGSRHVCVCTCVWQLLLYIITYRKWLKSALSAHSRKLIPAFPTRNWICVCACVWGGSCCITYIPKVAEVSVVCTFWEASPVSPNRKWICMCACVWRAYLYYMHNRGGCTQLYLYSLWSASVYRRPEVYMIFSACMPVHAVLHTIIMIHLYGAWSSNPFLGGYATHIHEDKLHLIKPDLNKCALILFLSTNTFTISDISWQSIPQSWQYMRTWTDYDQLCQDILTISSPYR